VASTPELRLTRLTLTGFRNYEALRLNVDEALISLTGPNGAGKTNILEAISLLSPGRGLRGAAYEELATQGGEPTWAVAAEIATPDGVMSLGTGWSGNEGPGQSRLVLVDGHVQRSSGVLGQHLRLLWLTPAMDRLFAGGGSERRRFLDRLVQAFDPEHGARVLLFEKVMRERNLLLEEPRPDSAWITSIEAHMAEAAVAIAAARLSALEALQGHIEQARDGSAFPWSRVSVEGDVEALIAAMPAVRAEDEYRRLLADSRHQDKAAGRALKGPHRSDFLVFHGPKDMSAGNCSTGEQKALLIGLILAQARAVKEATGTMPVLLLDEVAAHLDRSRRAGLFAGLAALRCQAWMTGTDYELFEDLGAGATHFHVDAGTVTQAKRE
jgi:DNA replication and repair protein RecF